MLPSRFAHAGCWFFVRKKSGSYGLSNFTADLLEDAKKADLDLAEIEKSAADYERVGPARSDDAGAAPKQIGVRPVIASAPTPIAP